MPFHVHLRLLPARRDVPHDDGEGRPSEIVLLKIVRSNAISVQRSLFVFSVPTEHCLYDFTYGFHFWPASLSALLQTFPVGILCQRRLRADAGP
jgi:hypothetical protein